MGPRLPENSHNITGSGDIGPDDDNQIPVPEYDGWRIGYEVEMSGLGIVNVYNVDQNADTSDDSYSSDCSDEEDDNYSEVKRAGYRPLLTDVSLTMIEAETENHVDRPPVRGIPEKFCFEGHNSLDVDLPPIVTKDYFKIPHTPVDIPLDEEKVSKIKSVMSNITLNFPIPAGWDKKVEDSKLANLVHALKNKIKVMNSKKRSTPEGDSLVNCEKANRGIWLVKVPRYLSEVWEKNAGSEVGKLVTSIGKSGTEVAFKNTAKLPVITPDPVQSGNSRAISSSSGNEIRKPMVKGASKTTEIPDEHRFLIGDLNNQTMAVLSEDKSGLEEEADFRTGKLCIEGRVVKKAECQPPNSLSYMKMKIKQIETVSQPKQYLQTIDKAVVKFKPTNAHTENLAKDKAKKDGAKTVRGDRDSVRQAIFHAFEKHQYYRLTDLQKLTNQPANFVKEILMDIANYNVAPPHKAMWELKPEYRNYNTNIS